MAGASKARGAKPRFGRSGTAGKGEGDEAVQAWIAEVKPEHRALAKELDTLITRTVPGVRKAVKWSSPMYGIPGRGWFVSFASFQEHLAIRFFAGTRLTPVPPEGEGKSGMRGARISPGQSYDAKLVRSWILQASKLKGWGNA